MHKLFKISLVFIFATHFALFSQNQKSTEINVLEYQIGKWLASDIQNSKDGRKLQFGYELQWFDQKKSIAKMTIMGVFEDGEVRVFWEGFKSWNLEEQKILYVGFSKDGRIANGYIEIVSDSVIKTIYSGNTPNGKKIFIEDIATIKDDKHYTTVTQVKIEGQDEWQTVNTDNWVRVNDQKFNDKI